MDIEAAVVVVDGKQWVKDLPELDNLEVLVAPWENKAFERKMSKLQRALPPALRADGVVDPAAYHQILGKAIAETILFDWKNFKSGGADKPFDKTYAQGLLVDPRYKPFRDGIIAAARRVQQGIVAEDKESEGKSSASSPGSATGEATPIA